MHEPTANKSAQSHPQPQPPASAAGTGTATPISIHSKPPQPPLYIPPGHVAFRLLCHASRVGGLIGKSGSIIKQLQQLTNSRIRVEDVIDSSDHRVISVVASAAVANKIRISASACASSPTEEEELNNGVTVSGDEEWLDVSAAQEGVVRVFERVVVVGAEGDAVSATAVAIGGVVSCKLLAWKNQAGAVIGKGGKVVEKIRKETGCRVKVLPLEKYLSRSSPVEEIVEIEGDNVAVKKALVAITGRLQEFPPLEKSKIYRFRSPVTVSMPVPNVDLPPQQSLFLQQMPSNSIYQASGGSLSSLESEKVSNIDCATPQIEVLFKILCPNEKVGGVIGKGGSIVKALENESGASINVGPALVDCDERLITITAMESVESQYSSAQNAAVLVFNKSAVAGHVNGLDSSNSKGLPVSARVAVPSNQVGCLLGKGGTIISEMRKVTGAGLRIIGGNQVPKCASENDEIVQITGEFSKVKDALYKVTGRLRDNLFSTKMPIGRGSHVSSRIENNACGRIRDLPPSGSHLSLGISESVNGRNSLTKSINHLGISSGTVDRPHLPSMLSSVRVSGVNKESGVKENSVDGSQRLPLLKGGVELAISGSRSAIVTNTTVEIVVSDDMIGSIYGENGNNLARLREISGAEVTVHEAHPGATQRSVFICGTPDQTQAAQSLLQAFILAGS